MYLYITAHRRGRVLRYSLNTKLHRFRRAKGAYLRRDLPWVPWTWHSVADRLRAGPGVDLSFGFFEAEKVIMESAVASQIGGSFFFTELDPEIQLKDSRDPLGFQPIWSLFGRKVIGNLTTVTTSVRGFTTLLLGHYFASNLVESGKVAAADYIDPFLRFEQISAYSRFAWAEETGDSVSTIRGIRRVEARYKNGNRRVRIAADRDGQILSNQKTYGLWGLYSVAATSSGLLQPSRQGLTPRATGFLERNVLGSLDQRKWGGLEGIGRLISSNEVTFEPWGKDKDLSRTLAELYSPTFQQAERSFYGQYLVNGAHCHPDGRQERLWRHIEQLNRRGAWGEFDMKELSAIAFKCRTSIDNLDGLLAEGLENIQVVEHVLVPSEQIFDFLLGQRGQTVSAVAGELRRRWLGAFGHLKPTRILDLAPEIEQASGDSSCLWMIALCLLDGSFERTIELILQLNERVMRRRSGGAWAAIKNGRIEVRYSDQTGDLMDSSKLLGGWHNTYFLNALKVVGRSVFAQEGAE